MGLEVSSNPTKVDSLNEIKPLLVLFFLLFLFPIGIFLMWRYKVWSISARWFITAILLMWLLLSIIYNNTILF